MRSRPSDAFVACAATLAAVLGLTTLTVTASWMGVAVWTCLAVAVAGIGMRRLTSRGVLVVLGQTVLVAWLIAVIFVGDRLTWGVPGPSAWGRIGELLQDCVEVMQKYAAPIPDTRGVELAIVLGVTALALGVDYLAVTRSAPAAAGLPLLTAFLTAAANSGSALHPFYFILAALVWMVLVSRQGQWSVRRWSTTVASPRTPTSARDVESDALGGFGTSARQFGVLALVAAVAVPAIVPHLPTRFILDGVGHSDTAEGRGGRVGFNSTLDLTRSLQDGTQNPVLTYRTSAPGTPPPLRVVVTSDYVDGEWRTRPGGTPRTQDLAAASVVSPQVAVTERTMTVEANELEPPHIASPQPVVRADFGATAWGVDPRTSDLYVRSRTDGYSLTYREVNVTAEQLKSGLPGAPTGQGDPEVAASLVLDPGSAPVVTQLADQVTSAAQAGTAYDSAVAIQEWLRSGGGFTYSLQLVRPVVDGTGATVTNPLSAFLVSKQGYCVQFASAMVMMARAKGIPARMAIGFLPGTSSEGKYTVHAADAHSWPELYFPGAGWLRFEPTPASRTGTPPAYTSVPAGDAGNTNVRGGVDDQGNPLVAPSAEPRDNGGLQDTSAPGAAGPVPIRDRFTAWFEDGSNLVLLAVGLGLLGTLVLPLTARVAHRRRRLRAANRAELAEAQWQELVSRLRDLGVSPPTGGTLRQWQRHYAREAYLDEDAEQSMGQVVATLERTRYGRPGAEPLSMTEDIRRVSKAAAVSRSHRHRVRAFFLPGDAVQWWSRVVTTVTAAPGRWLDAAVSRLPRRR